MQVKTRIERWPLRAPFRITGHRFLHIDVLVVTLSQGEFRGEGEAAGVYYKGETPEVMARQIEAVAPQVERGAQLHELQGLLPSGGARNALDCAFWDLEAKRRRLPVWRLAGLAEPRPLLTTYTLSAEDPVHVGHAAAAHSTAQALKLKLTGDGHDADRVRAVRGCRPDVWLGVDANQAFDPAALERLLPTLVDASVSLIEQPFPIGCEAALEGFDSPIEVAADESAQDLQDIPQLVDRFSMVNVKLDKCGGFSEALAMAKAARRVGLKVMVGNMGGTSLATAPAFLLAQLCDVVDLDGPLLLASDRERRATYEDGCVACKDDVWGGPLSYAPQ